MRHSSLLIKFLIVNRLYRRYEIDLWSRNAVLRKLLSIGLGLSLAAAPASADQNWDGDNGVGNFSNNNNWYGDSQPGWGFGGTLYFNFNNANATSIYYDYGSWVNTDNIYFTTTWPGSGHTGNITFDGNGNGINFNQKFENDSSSTITLGTINLSGGKNGASQIELNPVNGDIVINSTVNFYNDNSKGYHVYGNNGHALTVANTLGVGATPSSVTFTNENNNLVIFTGSQAYTGATTITGGTLQIGNNTTTGAINPGSAITNNAVLTFNRSNAVTQGTDFSSSSIGGSGRVIQAGAGTLTLSSSNSFSGGLAINAGTVVVSNANAMGSGTTTLGVTSGAANATLSSGANMTAANVINVASGAGSRTLVGTGGGGAFILSGSIVLSNTLNLNSTSSSGMRLNGVINEAVAGQSLIINSSNTTANNRLNGANTFTGGVVVQQGTLELTNNTGAGTGTITLGNTSGSANATLAVTQSSAISATNAITVAAGNSGTSSIINTLSASNTFSGAVALNHNLLLTSNSTGGLTLSGTITGGSGTNTITNAGTGAGALTLSGSIGNGTGTVAIEQNSTTSGLTISSGSNSFSGGVTIKSGTLTQTGTAGALGTGTITLGDGVSSNSATLNGNYGTGGITNANPITIASGGSGTYTIADINGSRDYNFSGNIALNNALTFKTTGGGALFISGTITGSSNISIDGNSNSGNAKFVNFSANNTSTYTGNIIVQNYGNFKVGSTTALGSSNAMTFDSTSKMDMGGLALTVAGLNDGPITTGTSTILNNGSGLTLGGTGTYSYSGVIANGGALIKSGTGSQTLSGFHTYTGNTTVSNGTLTITGTLANTAVAVNGGTLSLGHAGAINQNTITVGGGLLTETVDNSIGGTTALTINSGTANLANANNFSGAITINGGVVKLGNALALSTGTVGMSSGGGTLDLNGQSIANVLNISKAFTLMNSSASSAALTVDANVTNDFTIDTTGSMTATRFIGTSAVRTITKQGSGTLTTNGSSHNNLAAWNIQIGTVVFANTSGYGADRGVTLNGGTLRLSGANTDLINNGQSFVINSGTFDLNGKSEIIAAVSGSAGGVITNTLVSSTSTVTMGGDNGTATYAGSLQNGSGVLALAVSGTGTQTLSGSSSYSGGTTVSAGTLQVGNANALGSGTATLVSGSAVLDLNGQTISNVLSLSGTGLNGNGVLINSNTGTGATVSGNIVNNNFTVGGAGNISLTKLNQANTGATFTVAKIGAGTLSLTGTTLNYLMALTLDGGTVVLNKTNADTTFDWAIDRGATITSGTLKIGAVGEQIQTDNGITVNGGVFDLGGFSTLVNFVLGTGGVVTNSGSTAATLTVGATQFGSTSTSGTYSGVLQNGSSALALTKTGTSTFAISGSNTYTGATTISNGTLQVNTNNALGSTTAGTTVSSGAALKLNNVNYTAAEALTLNGTGNGGGGALTNTGTSTYAGAIIAVTNATITAGGSGQVLNLTGGITKNGTTLTVAGGGRVNVSGIGISGTAANSDLVVDNSTLVVKADSNYNGPTTIQNSGTLEINNDGGSNPGKVTTTAITVTTGGTLLLGGTSAVTDRISNSTPVNLDGGTFNTGGNTETVGALTLSVNSTIDFSSSQTGTLTFTDATRTGGLLTIDNWLGSFGGGSPTHLVFTGVIGSGFLANVQFSGYGVGANAISYGGGYELAPIPEPATIIGAMAFVGLIVLRERRRFGTIRNLSKHIATDNSVSNPNS